MIYMQESRHNIQTTEAKSKLYSGRMNGNTAEIRGILVLTTFVIFPCISRVYMDQLEDERSPGYHTCPAGQQVPAHQALQH